MNKMLLTIAIALVILAIVAVPVSAVLPPNSPLPSSTTFNKIWDLFLNLQNQINSINSEKSQVVILKNHAHNGDTVLAPEGYSIDQCDLIPHSEDIKVKAHMGDLDYTLFSQVHQRVEVAGEWHILSHSGYTRVDGTPGVEYMDDIMHYTIICQK
jgi:hypothetical protein